MYPYEYFKTIQNNNTKRVVDEAVVIIKKYTAKFELRIVDTPLQQRKYRLLKEERFRYIDVLL